MAKKVFDFPDPEDPDDGAAYTDDQGLDGDACGVCGGTGIMHLGGHYVDCLACDGTGWKSEGIKHGLE